MITRSTLVGGAFGSSPTTHYCNHSMPSKDGEVFVIGGGRLRQERITKVARDFDCLHSRILLEIHSFSSVAGPSSSHSITPSPVSVRSQY